MHVGKFKVRLHRGSISYKIGGKFEVEASKS